MYKYVYIDGTDRHGHHYHKHDHHDDSAQGQMLIKRITMRVTMVVWSWWSWP